MGKRRNVDAINAEDRMVSSANGSTGHERKTMSVALCTGIYIHMYVYQNKYDLEILSSQGV